MSAANTLINFNYTYYNGHTWHVFKSPHTGRRVTSIVRGADMAPAPGMNYQRGDNAYSGHRHDVYPLPVYVAETRTRITPRQLDTCQPAIPMQVYLSVIAWQQGKPMCNHCTPATIIPDFESGLVYQCACGTDYVR